VGGITLKTTHRELLFFQLGEVLKESETLWEKFLECFFEDDKEGLAEFNAKLDENNKAAAILFRELRI
jgi:hypothetical protein